RVVGREASFNGTFTVLEELNNDSEMKIELLSDTLRNGEWKPMVIKLPAAGVCSTIKKYFDTFIKNSFITGQHTNFDFQNGDLCPIPKGEFWLKNVVFNTENWLDIMPTGFIKAQLTMSKDNIFGGSLAFVIDVQSKS
ncbi:hypothetical protein KR044_007528, partial [Drosophila immigrans]